MGNNRKKRNQRNKKPDNTNPDVLDRLVCLTGLTEEQKRIRRWAIERGNNASYTWALNKIAQLNDEATIEARPTVGVPASVCRQSNLKRAYRNFSRN